MSGFEKNRNSLRQALQQLPSYTPPADMWERVVDNIDRPVVDESPLVEAVRSLPGHTPPSGVWNALARHLDDERGAKIRQLRTRRQWMTAAAAVALVLGVAWWVFREPPPKISIQYAQETVQQFQLDIDWDADTDIFAQLEQQLSSVNNPTVNKLKVEYEELSLARKDVESMLKSYGQDPQLVRKMADIERERTDIYRQIIALI